jgi:hypothetical protein
MRPPPHPPLFSVTTGSAIIPGATLHLKDRDIPLLGYGQDFNDDGTLRRVTFVTRDPLPVELLDGGKLMDGSPAIVVDVKETEESFVTVTVLEMTGPPSGE